MKTKFLLFGLLVSLFLVSSTQAQTVTEVYEGDWTRTMWECDGDFLYGTFSGIQLTHFNKNGDVDWVKHSIKAEVVSATTGEVFKVSQHVRENLASPGETHYFVFHQTFVGNMGTRYLIAITFEIDPGGVWNIVKEKAKCL